MNILHWHFASWLIDYHSPQRVNVINYRSILFIKYVVVTVDCSLCSKRFVYKRSVKRFF